MRTRTLHILLALFGVLFVVSQANLIALLGDMGPAYFQMQTTLSVDTFRGILDGWSAEEQARYRESFSWDSVHPLLYGGLLLTWALVVHRHGAVSSARLPLLVTLAVAPSVLDYLENACHLYLEVHRDEISSGSVVASGLAADAKWLVAAVALVWLITASVQAVRAR
ncbi:MAG: hypothetical protein ACRDT4_21210 [Micromonosporaceae bacterium]